MRKIDAWQRLQNICRWWVHPVLEERKQYVEILHPHDALLGGRKV